jgi:hypothetical protein
VYNIKYRGSAYREFEKCKRIAEMYENYDSSATEQAL